MSKTISMLPLNDGYDIPLLGLTSFRTDPEEKLRQIILDHTDNGIRHIEIAELFGNGLTVIDTLLDGGAELKREKLYITFKVWSKNRNKDDILQIVKDTLSYYRLDFIDLLLIHGPLDVINRIEQYKAIEELKNEGYVHSIGLSNMTHTQLSNILKKCNVCPAVIEMEITPFNQAQEVAEFCHDNGIVILCDNPLAKDIYSDRVDILQIAESLQISVQQLLIRWCISKGYGVLLPPQHRGVGNDLKALVEPLSANVMEEMESLNESLMTTWQTNEEGGDEGTAGGG